MYFVPLVLGDSRFVKQSLINEQHHDFPCDEHELELHEQHQSCDNSTQTLRGIDQIRKELLLLFHDSKD